VNTQHSFLATFRIGSTQEHYQATASLQNTTSTPKVWKSAVPVISSQGHASGVVHQFAKRPSSQVQVDQWQNGAKYKWQLLFLHMAGNSLNLPQEYHFS
tara:strand:- start:428 stop:724 length:297 start_codon:yes stop_codon:yes gene_type:complete